jgi:hypothetical protein
LQVLSNLRQVQNDGNSKALEKRLVTDARQFQDLRSFE